MQIPPSTVRSIKNSIRLKALLDEMRTSRYTGYCVISQGDNTYSIVLEKGECLLAESPKAKGDTAYQEILVLENKEINAVLYGLTSGQVGLTVKFNNDCRTGGELSDRESAKTTTTTVIRPISKKGHPGRIVNIKMVSKAGQELPEDQGNSPALQYTFPSPAPPGNKVTPGDVQVERLSIASLKGLKDSFRVDAANLLKELELDHLIVEKGEPANPKKSMAGPEKDRC